MYGSCILRAGPEPDRDARTVVYFWADFADREQWESGEVPELQQRVLPR